MLERLQRLPGGLTLFSWAVCFKAPYFRTIHPRFVELRPGYARARLRKRWGVTNHLGSVHAIAMANLCEFIGGTLMEISIRRDMRWIPRGMEIEYLARATTDLTGICALDQWEWQEKQDVVMTVNVFDSLEQPVARARIPMYVSPRPAG